MKFGIVQFPGSNCDQDAYYAAKDVLGVEAEYLWHQTTDLRGSDIVIVPGGFSFGDYLRCGAIANFSPIMQAVKDFASRGGLVVGICNGFQVLCEAHLLPGALVRNDGQHFVCRHVNLTVENAQTPFTRGCTEGQKISIPVAHGEGRYVCDEAVLEQLKATRQIVFKYATDDDNPNGSVDNIAGIANATFNVFGLMPHPERACDLSLGSSDGLFLLKSLLQGAK